MTGKLLQGIMNHLQPVLRVRRRDGLRVALLDLAGILTVLVCVGIVLSALFGLCRQGSSPGVGTVLSFVAGLGACAALVRYGYVLSGVREGRAVVILVGIGLLLRIASISLIRNYQVSDYLIYHELAIALANGDGFAYTGHTGLAEDVGMYLNRPGASGPVPTSFRPPGYPFLLAGLYRITGPHVLIGKLLNLLLGIGIGLLLFLLLRSISTPSALVALGLWMIYPSAILATNVLGTELAFTFTILGAACLLQHGLSSDCRRGLWFTAFSGLVTGYAALIRGGAGMPAICGILVVALCGHSRSRRAVLVAAFAAAVCIGPASWGFRNYRLFGEFHVGSTNVGQAMLMYAPFIGEKHGADPDYERFRSVHGMNEFELNRLGKRMAWTRIATLARSNLIGLIRDGIIRNFAYTWESDRAMLRWSTTSSHGRTVRVLEKPTVSSSTRQVLYHIVGAGYLVIVLLSLVGSHRLRIAGKVFSPGILLLVFYLLFAVATYSLFRGMPRFHFPLVAVLCLVGAFAARPMCAVA